MVNNKPVDIWSDDTTMYQRYGNIASRCKFETIWSDFGCMRGHTFKNLGDGFVSIPWYTDDSRSVRSLQLHWLNNRTVLRHVLSIAQSQRDNGMLYEMGPPAYLVWSPEQTHPLLLAAFGHRALGAYHNFENHFEHDQVQQMYQEGLKCRYIFHPTVPKPVVLWLKSFSNSFSGYVLAESIFEWYTEYGELAIQFKATSVSRLDAKSLAYKNSQLQFFMENGNIASIKAYVKNVTQKRDAPGPGETRQFTDDYCYARFTLLLSVANRLSSWGMLQTLRTYFGEHIIDVAVDQEHDACPSAPVLSELFHKFKIASDQFASHLSVVFIICCSCLVVAVYLRLCFQYVRTIYVAKEWSYAQVVTKQICRNSEEMSYTLGGMHMVSDGTALHAPQGRQQSVYYSSVHNRIWWH